MTTLYAIVPRTFAEALEAGTVSLREIPLLSDNCRSAIDTIEISNDFSPPLVLTDTCLRISLPVPPSTLMPYDQCIMDAPGNTYDLPRAWLDRAVFEVIPDAEILALCREQLPYLTIPCGRETFGTQLRRQIASGHTEGISPFYIQGVRENP